MELLSIELLTFFSCKRRIDMTHRFHLTSRGTTTAVLHELLSLLDESCFSDGGSVPFLRLYTEMEIRQ
jgi:hypothetical protein